MTAPALELPWYRRPVRVPVWFVLVALLGWGVHLWHGVSPPERGGLVCAPARNPYRTGLQDPTYVCKPPGAR